LYFDSFILVSISKREFRNKNSSNNNNIQNDEIIVVQDNSMIPKIICSIAAEKSINNLAVPFIVSKAICEFWWIL
jgi:hypothetical protein